MQRGALSRATATTRMNDLSSRSHAVFIIIVEQMTTVQGGD
jgi:kinesin family protein 3/17